MNGNACNVTMLKSQPMTKFEKEFDAWKTAYKSKYSECKMLTEQVDQLKTAICNDMIPPSIICVLCYTGIVCIVYVGYIATRHT